MKFPLNLNCDGKIDSEMGPWYDMMTRQCFYWERSIITKLLYLDGPMLIQVYYILSDVMEGCVLCACFDNN